MRKSLGHLAPLLALTILVPRACEATGANIAMEGSPPGFDNLSSDRVTLVDVYFGDRKVAEALAVIGPGRLTFKSPSEVIAKVPDLIAAPELQSALASTLPTHSDLACSMSNAGDCGVISPNVAEIIYDEDRFRVDLFVNPRFLRVSTTLEKGYLPTPDASLSLTNAIGINASGTIGGSSAYNFQNRTIIALRNARIRANTSVASHLGFVVDDLVGEFDSKSLRYSAGLFWAPGNEFIGQRRIIGAGVGTQFDTWADQEALRGTPLIVFLAQPSRVELLVDGRLVSSRSYPAGNIDLDTSALTSGSYTVVLRIHEPNGSVREERRFFVKNEQVAPAGHPIFYAFGGFLANTRPHQPVSASNTFYYQAGSAWRLSNNFALDVSALGTQHKLIVEGGAWFIKGPVRLRAAGLVSSTGDAGGLLQFGTSGQGPFTANLDIRHIWSKDGPLIPFSSYANTFDFTPPTGIQLANGSYTQATGSVGIRLGSGYLSIVASYRKDHDYAADYTVGPNITWPLVSRNRIQLVFEASAQKTRTATAAFAGFRALLTSGRMSISSTTGGAYQNESGGGGVSRVVSNLTAQFSHETQAQTLFNVEAGVDRNISSSFLHAGGTFYGNFGNGRADILHDLEGKGGSQYDIGFQSGFALGSSVEALGARSPEQSAFVVTVNGDARDATFDVLVDDVSKGRVRVGERLSLFVPGYRTYRVRLVPVEAVNVSYDTAAREVTLYPGNVRALAWDAESYFTLFGQAVSPAGRPMANALVQTAKNIAQTDENGFFQIDVRRGDAVMIGGAGEASCRLPIGNAAVSNDYASVGKVVCQ